LIARARTLPGSLLLPAFLLVYALFFIGTVDGRLSGDDHYALAHGYALIAGDRLNVDFFDPGTPLQTWLSYVGQLVSGSRTIAEVAIALTLRMIGLTAIYFVTKKLVGNRFVAVAVPLFVSVWLMQQTIYGAEKVALYPIAALAAWRYLEGRLSPYALSLMIAIAALFRHDHGVYIGLSMVIAVALGPRPQRDVIKMAAATLLLLAPWLIWLQATEGVVPYITSRVAFAQDNGLGTPRPFGLDSPLWSADNAAPWLWHVALFTVLAAVATSIYSRSKPAMVLAGMAFVTAAGLMRKTGQAEEVAAIWVPLFVWMLWTWRWYGKVILTGVAAISVVAMLTTTEAVDELSQIANDGGGLRQRVRRAWEFHMTTPPIDAYAPDEPDETSDGRLIIRYLHACLRPTDRIWETSMWFPVAYYADRRPVWHYHWDHGLKNDEPSQRQFLEWLKAQQAPVIVAHSDEGLLKAFRDYSLVRPYVEANYRELTSEKFRAYQEDGNRIWLLGDIRRTPTGRFEPLDLPCYR
jgi:hypothetical protein